MRRRPPRARGSRAVASGALAAVLCLVAGLAGCGGGDEGPPGYLLRIRLVSVDPEAIDELRLNFVPEDGQRFMSTEPMVYQEGAVEVRVASDGVLEMDIDGAYVADMAVDQGDGTSIVEVEVWTRDDRVRDPPPFLRVIAYRDGAPIAEGFNYLPEWPLPSGGEFVIPVSCRSDAAAMGLCRN